MADTRQLSSASQTDHDEHTTSTGKTALYVSVAQELQVQTATTREETYYGSEPEEYWTAVLPEETQYQNRQDTQRESESSESESFHFVLRIDSSDLEIGRMIAEGGQAEVFLATYTNKEARANISLGRNQVVVKRLKNSSSRVVDVLQLQRRMESLMKLKNDERIRSVYCWVFGVSVDDNTGTVSIVMEAMKGDLRNLIDDRLLNVEDGQMPFNYTETLLMMMDITSGLLCLHSKGIIHRDIKSSNILVSPRIVDIRNKISEKATGLANLADVRFKVRLGDYETSDGVVGTGFWRAPEVLQHLKAVRDGNGLSDNKTPTYSAAVDVYGLGMLFYELLSGKIPFEGHPVSDYDLVLLGARPELPTHVTQKMKQLLCRCWHAEPQKRPTLLEIAKTLHEEFTQYPPTDPNNIKNAYAGLLRNAWE
jgi:serine/threonine protein kinase